MSTEAYMRWKHMLTTAKIEVLTRNPTQDVCGEGVDAIHGSLPSEVLIGRVVIV